jgi:hypothetical protein
LNNVLGVQEPSELEATTVTIQLVDYTQLVQEAISSVKVDLDELYPPEVQDSTIDSLRYPHAIAGCWDVARLVAIGCIQLGRASVKENNGLSLDSTPSVRCNSELMSHVVYTSGTTGEGCRRGLVFNMTEKQLLSHWYLS